MYSGALSIAEFCSAHRISRAHLYNLLKRSKCPSVMKAGRRSIISLESAASWCRAMEQPATDKQIGEV